MSFPNDKALQTFQNIQSGDPLCTVKDGNDSFLEKGFGVAVTLMLCGQRSRVICQREMQRCVLEAVLS